MGLWDNSRAATKWGIGARLLPGEFAIAKPKQTARDRADEYDSPRDFPGPFQDADDHNQGEHPCDDVKIRNVHAQVTP